jgi:hypothetical protein
MFAELARGMHQGWISDLYLEEIERTPDPQRREELMEVIATYGLQLLSVTPDVLELAEDYIAAQAFTEGSRADARHVAMAVLGGCDVVVSWNFKHIVRLWTIQRVLEVNTRRGLGPVVICTPKEVSPV